MTLTTQAGVTLGLANGIRRTHRDRWGPTVADAIVAAVILNQFVGPFLFKYAARKLGEAHDRDGQPGHSAQDAAPGHGHGGGHTAVGGSGPQKKHNVMIFGLTPLSVLVGCKLKRNHCSVRIVRDVYRASEGEARLSPPPESDTSRDDQLASFAESSGIALDEFPFLSLLPSLSAPPPRAGSPAPKADLSSGEPDDVAGGDTKEPVPAPEGEAVEVTVDDGPEVTPAPVEHRGGTAGVSVGVAELQQLLWVTPPWAVLLMLPDDETNAAWGQAVTTVFSSSSSSAIEGLSSAQERGECRDMQNARLTINFQSGFGTC